MGELTLNLVRLGVIVLLWTFVFSVVGVLRGDLYGTRVSRNAGPARPTRPGPARLLEEGGSPPRGAALLHRHGRPSC